MRTRPEKLANGSLFFLFLYLLKINFMFSDNIHIYMIVWLLDFQLPVQSVPVTTEVVSSNLVHDEVCLIHYVKNIVRDLQQVDGFLHQ